MGCDDEEKRGLTSEAQLEVERIFYWCIKYGKMIKIQIQIIDYNFKVEEPEKEKTIAVRYVQQALLWCLVVSGGPDRSSPTDIFFCRHEIISLFRRGLPKKVFSK